MNAQNAAPRFEVSIHKEIIGKDPDAIRAEGWETKSRTAMELLNELTREGFAVVPATLKSSRRTKDQFEEASLVMLDFDSGQTLDELKMTEFVQKYGLFAYSTHSHVPGEKCQRFRLATGLDTTITNRDHYEAVIRHLVNLLGSDPACTDACRLYYGNPGAEITWLNEDAELLQIASLPVPARKTKPISKESLDWSQSDREKALTCLEFIPPRGPKGSGTYPDSIRALFALLNTFGEEEARALVEEAEWQGDWDLDEVIEGALSNPAHDRGCGMGTLIQIAKDNGMPANLANSRNSGQKAKDLTKAVKEIAKMKHYPGAHTWADIDIRFGEITGQFSMSTQKLNLRIEQCCGELLGIDIGAMTKVKSYNIEDEWASVDDEDAQTSFLLPGIIREKGTAMLVSAGGVGKTEMACAIAKCIANGEGFMHHSDVPVEGGKRTLFIEADMENGARRCITDYFINAGIKPEEAKQWLSRWVRLWCAEPDKGIPSWRFTGPALLQLKEEIQSGNYGLVVIDSLKKITVGTDFEYTKNSEMHLMLTLLSGIVTPYASLLILHHTNKSESDGMGAIGGASSIGEMVDAVHKLSRKDIEGEDSAYTFETTKARNGINNCKFRYDRDENGTFYVLSHDLSDKENDLGARILNTLAFAASSKSGNAIVKTSEIAESCGAKIKTVSNKLTALHTARPRYVRKKGTGWEITRPGMEHVEELRAKKTEDFKRLLGRSEDF
jgi:hypothetical protein